MPHPKDACPDCGAPKGVDRARCRRCAGLARRTAKHGTDSRYFRHLRDGDKPCEACIAAHRTANAEAYIVRRDAKRRARAQARAARLVCPSCGGVKSPKAKTCRQCAGFTGRPRTANHGTDSGYYRHVRKPDPANGWPRTACDECLAAHAAAERKRTGGQPAPTPRRKTCQVCGVRVSRGSDYCRSCAQRDRFGTTPVREWKRVGMIWKAA